MDLTKAENNKWQEYTEIKNKNLMTQINTMMLSLTQSQTSWSAKSNKASGGDGIPGELFQILKKML